MQEQGNLRLAVLAGAHLCPQTLRIRLLAHDLSAPAEELLQLYWLRGNPHTPSCEHQTLNPRAAASQLLCGHCRLLQADPCTSDSKLVENMEKHWYNAAR